MKNSFTRRLTVLVASITCFSVFDCQAAAGLSGVVKRNQMGGESMSMVEISASRGANPTATDSSGRFKLAFPRLDPGDRVDVDARFKGWVVVNYEQLAGLNLPKEAGANPLIILLAQEAEREQWRMAFYRIKGIENVTQEYQRKLANLEKTGTATRQERDILARERDQALAMVDALAKQFATVKPGDGDALYRQATQLFLNNRLDQALSLLNEKKLQDSADQAMKMEEDARSIKEETARNYRLRGQFLALRFQFVDAAKAYGAATKLLPNDFQSWFDFAVFHQELNHFLEARQGYEKALTVAHTNPDIYQPNLAMALNNIGILYRKQNRFDESLNAFGRALGIYRDFAHAAPDIYLPYVATTLNNLANVHSDQNRLNAAYKAYGEVLTIRRALAHTNPDTYVAGVADVLNNLALIYRNQNRFVDARNAYDESLGIYRDLACAAPDTYQAYVATTLNNLAVLHRDQNHFYEASKAFEEALVIRGDLARTNPDTYLPYVAETLNNLAMLFSDQNHLDEALKSLENALTIRRDLARANPDVYEADVAETLNNLAILYSDKNRFDEALKALEDALEIFRHLALSNPDTYRSYVSNILNNLTNLHGIQKRYSEAFKTGEEALTIRRSLAHTNPDTYRPYMATTLNNLANLHRDQNRYDEARKAYEEALGIYREFAVRNPERYAPYVRKVQANLDQLPK